MGQRSSSSCQYNWSWSFCSDSFVTNRYILLRWRFCNLLLGFQLFRRRLVWKPDWFEEYPIFLLHGERRHNHPSQFPCNIQQLQPKLLALKRAKKSQELQGLQFLLMVSNKRCELRGSSPSNALTIAVLPSDRMTRFGVRLLTNLLIWWCVELARCLKGASALF